MYIPLSDDKHRKVRDSSKKCTGNPRQIQSENFFRRSEIFFFFWTEFYLGLHTTVVFRMQSFNLLHDCSVFGASKQQVWFIIIIDDFTCNSNFENNDVFITLHWA